MREKWFLIYLTLEATNFKREPTEQIDLIFLNSYGFNRNTSWSMWMDLLQSASLHFNMPHFSLIFYSFIRELNYLTPSNFL